MAIFVIPTRTDLANYSMQVDLEGVTYRFDFRFSEREGFWYFDLLDVAGSMIRAGVKVVTGMSLTRLLRDTRRPPGELAVMDTTDQDREAGFEDLGEEILLFYADQADVLAAVATG